MNYLVVDYGTSGCRASLVDGSGRISVTCRKPASVECSGEFAEIDTDYAWAVTASVIRDLLVKTGNPDIDAVGISSLLGWVFLDSSGRPLTKSFIWSDSRGSLKLESAIEPDKADICRKTGRRLSRELLVSKWAWLKENSPETVSRTSRIISLKDELVRRLTGETVTDYAHLNYTMLWNIHEHGFEPQTAELSGFRPELLVRGRYPFEAAGRVTAEASAAAGLKQGLPVITGSIDGTTAMYGGGMAAGNCAVLVSGTTDVAMTLVPAEKIAIYGGRDVLTVNTGMVPGTFAVGGSTGMSGGALSKMAELLEGGYYELIESAGEIAPGAGGIVFSPGLTGERAPFWNVNITGALSGLRMEHTSAHIIRAVMEGSAFRLRKLFDEMFRDSGFDGSIYTVGGYAGIDIWNRIKADICGLPLILPEELEATTIGTAMFCDCFINGTVGLGAVSRRWIKASAEYPADADNFEAYAGPFQKYEQLVKGQMYGQ